MTDQKARLHQWFHLFLVNFALWAFGVFAILYGIRFIYEAKMDGYSGSPDRPVQASDRECLAMTRKPRKDELPTIT
jgi:hypothetical protein